MSQFKVNFLPKSHLVCVHLVVTCKLCGKSHCFLGKFTQLTLILHDCSQVHMRRSWIGSPGSIPPTCSPWPASSAPWSSTDLWRRGRDLFLALVLHSTPPTRRSNSILAGNYNSRVESSANGKLLILGMCVLFPCGTHFNHIKVLKGNTIFSFLVVLDIYFVFFPSLIPSWKRPMP